MCEDALVAAAKQGQAEAFATLCQPYAQRLIRNAHRITRNHEDAEDALQDAFLSAFIHIQNFDGRSSFSTWLTRIAINSALMTLRKKRSSRETSIGFGESDAKGLGGTYRTLPRIRRRRAPSARTRDFLGRRSATYDRPFDGLLRFNSCESSP